jgi:hypothetical protein
MGSRNLLSPSACQDGAALKRIMEALVQTFLLLSQVKAGAVV